MRSWTRQTSKALVHHDTRGQINSQSGLSKAGNLLGRKNALRATADDEYDIKVPSDLKNSQHLLSLFISSFFYSSNFLVQSITAYKRRPVQLGGNWMFSVETRNSRSKFKQPATGRTLRQKQC